jgi:hypothetical protein
MRGTGQKVGLAVASALFMVARWRGSGKGQGVRLGAVRRVGMGKGEGARAARRGHVARPAEQGRDPEADQWAAAIVPGGGTD